MPLGVQSRGHIAHTLGGQILVARIRAGILTQRAHRAGRVLRGATRRSPGPRREPILCASCGANRAALSGAVAVRTQTLQREAGQGRPVFRFRSSNYGRIRERSSAIERTMLAQTSSALLRLALGDLHQQRHHVRINALIEMRKPRQHQVRVHTHIVDPHAASVACIAQQLVCVRRCLVDILLVQGLKRVRERKHIFIFASRSALLGTQ